MKSVWLAAGILTALVVIVTLHDVLLIFFAAAIFAIPLRAGAVATARALHISAGAGLVLCLIVIVAFVGAVVWGWERLLAAQLAQLSAALPAAAEGVMRAMHEEPWVSRLAQFQIDPGVLLTGAGGAVGVLRGFLGGTIAGVVDVAILLFAAVCFAAEPRTYVNGFLRLIPPQRRARVDSVLGEAAGTVGLWLRARAISMLAIALLCGFGLSALGIPDPAALGVLAGILAFIPNVGSVGAALPALLLAAPLGWERVSAVALLYWIAHALDDFIVIPVAERRVVHLPPALTIAAQLILGLASGVVGIMMAAPFVAVAIVAVRRLVVEDVVERDASLGETSSPPLRPPKNGE